MQTLKNIKVLADMMSGQMPIHHITKDDAEVWLAVYKDIYNTTNANSYELAELLKDFANYVLQNKPL